VLGKSEEAVDGGVSKLSDFRTSCRTEFSVQTKFRPFVVVPYVYTQFERLGETGIASQ